MSLSPEDQSKVDLALAFAHDHWSATMQRVVDAAKMRGESVGHAMAHMNDPPWPEKNPHPDQIEVIEPKPKRPKVHWGFHDDNFGPDMEAQLRQERLAGD